MSEKKKPTPPTNVLSGDRSVGSQQPNIRQDQSLLLIWLDATIDENNGDCQKNIAKLRKAINILYTFVDINECINFINEIDGKKAFVISSGALGQTIVPIVHDMSQISAIYIFCGNKSRHEQWAQQWPKIKDVFTDIKPICKMLKNAVRECDQHAVPISFVASNSDMIGEHSKPAVKENKENTTSLSSVVSNDGISIQNMDQLDSSFMYTQILKELLLIIEFDPHHIKEFLDYCRCLFAENDKELKTVDQFERKYHKRTPIWWYTGESFIYPMLNHALRTMDIDMIIKMGFFLCDLHRHIAKLHSEQNSGHNRSELLTVYRGHGLSTIDFDRLAKAKGGLLSFNIFLSTSKDREVSLDYARCAIANPDMMGILFVMTIDPFSTSTPFAGITDVGFYGDKENEVLFSMHSIFRVRKIERIDETNRLWQVHLFSTGDNDPELHALAECVRKETFLDEKPWYRLGELLIKMGHFGIAEELYNGLLEKTSATGEKISVLRQLRRAKEYLGKYLEAIQLGEHALDIQKRTLHPNHPDIAINYTNIGSVYEKMGEYSKILSFHEKALEIQKLALPSNHPDLATSYNNIGSDYEKMGEYSKALSCHKKALEIQTRTLPPDHPDIAITYSNIGSVYEKMGKYSKALSCHEKALEIQTRTLPPDHPDIAITYSNIGSVYEKMGEYSKALTFHEKALEIQIQSLPANHPDLASTYNNIGSTYEKMGELMNALSYQGKAFKILQQSLSPNHPNLAISYHIMGKVLSVMGEYPKALSAHEKALEIQTRSLPSNHPDLAMSNYNIGRVYTNMGNYSKAFSFYERALNIGQHSLPKNHPDLQTYEKDFETLKKQM